VDSDVVEQRIVEQAERLGAYGTVTGWAALRWLGAAYFDGSDRAGARLPVPLCVGAGCLRPDPQVAILKRQLPLWEWDVVRGLRTATWERALFDEMIRLRTVRPSVVALDMCLAAGLGSLADFRGFLERVRPRNGVVLARDAVALGRDSSWSPQESWMRLCWMLDAQLPEPLSNVPVFDLRGRLLGIPDLFDPVAGVVGEYQGAVHRSRERHQQDVVRRERFREAGLEYFEVVAGELQDIRTATRMRRCRERARFLQPDERRWTLDRPEWWTDPDSRHRGIVRIRSAGDRPEHRAV